MADPTAARTFERLSPEIVSLLRRVSAPPRLVAHLIIVHDVASQLVLRVSQAFPGLQFDKEAVLFGAATHDIGKAIHVEELVQPGKNHERCGVELLTELGVPADRTRFAYTHGNSGSEDILLEDLLVSLADNCWKGKRVDDLERKTVEILSSASGRPAWDCYAALDDILESLAGGADARLEWQRQFGTQRIVSSG